MLLLSCMKATHGFILGSLLFSSVAFAHGSPMMGSDFVHPVLRPHVVRSVVASPRAPDRAADRASARPLQVGTMAPDFVGAAPRPHIDRSLTASDQTTPIDPGDVLNFANDQAAPTLAGYEQIDAAARWLKSHPRQRIVLEGHTDRVGDAVYNEDLATRRIDMVRRRLLRNGISSDRIVLITYGEREAIAPENPNDRRVVMYVTELSPQAVIAMTMTGRDAVVATWTEKGALMQQQGQSPPTRSIISRR